MLGQAMKLFLGVSLLSYAVVDAKLYFTNPVGQTWTAGQKYDITWIDYPNSSPLPKTFDILLMDGNINDLNQVHTIATNVESSKGSFEWTIPKDLVKGEYVISGCGGYCVYTHSFYIDSAYKGVSQVNHSTSSLSKSESSTTTESASATKIDSPDVSSSKALKASKTSSHSNVSSTKESSKVPKTVDHSTKDSKTAVHSSETPLVNSSKSDEHSPKSSGSSKKIVGHSTSLSLSVSGTSSASGVSPSATPEDKSKHHQSGSSVARPMIFVALLSLGSSLVTLA